MTGSGKIRVLAVDDAVLMRRMITDGLASEPDIEVVGTAANGRIAVAKMDQLSPDVIVLDIEMPEMGGIETLKRIRESHPSVHVIMFSTLTDRGAAATIEALSCGADDYVQKPSQTTSLMDALGRVRQELVPRIRSLCNRAAPAQAPVSKPAGSVKPRIAKVDARIDILTIGTSTGGPNALHDVLADTPGEFPVPIVIVQHMPERFTRLLAERLNSQCALEVLEGEEGMSVIPGRAIIAPGGYHMVVERNGDECAVALNSDPPENSCRPAVDVLFRSVVKHYGRNTLALIMTGMGSDGLRGSEEVDEAGGQIVVQDEHSSVVWGMPGYVAKAGIADIVLPLSKIASELNSRANTFRGQNVAIAAKKG